jgi:hypothetical protein|tara:strand:- start:1190 stop:1339 length:150 start_codon:yes stop_codon:yes gene_type:complete
MNQPEDKDPEEVHDYCVMCGCILRWDESETMCLPCEETHLKDSLYIQTK